MLAGLFNLCHDYGHSNYEKLFGLLNDVQQATAVSMKETKAKVLKSQQYMKTQFTKHAERHSPCLELCMSHAFGSCSESHPSCFPDVVRLLEVEKYVKETLPRIANAAEHDQLMEDLQDVMNTHTQYVSHLLRTKHQGDYYKFILANLQPGDAVVIVDYKMKLELGVRLREIRGTDNGPHYHNTAFLLYLCKVNLTFNLTLVEYNNFKAGEGKSMLDTHFVHISHKIVHWVRVGDNLETGNQLGELIGLMTNVKCRKLQINRSKAPDKVGTLKDISLYRSFQLPTSGTYSGGLIARIPFCSWQGAEEDQGADSSSVQPHPSNC
ncbi:hypothetical protein OS493_027265 [Desmophyllum pertusum]|uniref:Uncharacterized protein n=1 Tax=Desmophyllum pertusum TaxID=174260 RepID=A0A9W9Z9Q0_9CNID|nr:hypothetical protein OS493_027265 [Desmophyllum pertusum]